MHWIGGLEYYIDGSLLNFSLGVPFQPPICISALIVPTAQLLCVDAPLLSVWNSGRCQRKRYSSSNLCRICTARVRNFLNNWVKWVENDVLYIHDNHPQLAANCKSDDNGPTIMGHFGRKNRRSWELSTIIIIIVSCSGTKLLYYCTPPIEEVKHINSFIFLKPLPVFWESLALEERDR